MLQPYSHLSLLVTKINKDIQIINGDCLEVMSEIPNSSIDLIVCDLPYGQTARNRWDIIIPFEPLWIQYKRIVKPNAAIILFANGMFTADLMQSNREMWKYNIVWEKTQPTGHLNARKMPLRNHEDICVFFNEFPEHGDICVFYKNPPVYNPQKAKGHKRKISKAEHKNNCKMSTDYGKHKFTSYDSTERYPKSVWKYPKDTQKSAIHPTQKPLALIKDIIKTYSNEGDTVLDNCFGSNTTGVACVELDRKYIGIEKDISIFRLGKERMEKTIREINGYSI